MRTARVFEDPSAAQFRRNDIEGGDAGDHRPGRTSAQGTDLCFLRPPWALRRPRSRQGYLEKYGYKNADLSQPARRSEMAACELVQRSPFVSHLNFVN